MSIDLSEDSVTYTINASIVEVIIGELFFRKGDDADNDNDDEEDMDEQAIAKNAVLLAKQKQHAMKQIRWRGHLHCRDQGLDAIRSSVGSHFNRPVIPPSRPGNSTHKGQNENGEAGKSQRPDGGAVGASTCRCFAATDRVHPGARIGVGILVCWGRQHKSWLVVLQHAPSCLL